MIQLVAGSRLTSNIKITLKITFTLEIFADITRTLAVLLLHLKFCKKILILMFNHDLNEIFKSYPNASNDPNELWSDFKTKFLTIADKHAPIKQRRVKSEFKPWITNEIRRLSYHRDYLKRQGIRLRSVYCETAYKKCKNKVTNLIRTSKESYFKSKLSNSNNSKESYNLLMSF